MDSKNIKTKIFTKIKSQIAHIAKEVSYTAIKLICAILNPLNKTRNGKYIYNKIANVLCYLCGGEELLITRLKIYGEIALIIGSKNDEIAHRTHKIIVTERKTNHQIPKIDLYQGSLKSLICQIYGKLNKKSQELLIISCEVQNAQKLLKLKPNYLVADDLKSAIIRDSISEDQLSKSLCEQIGEQTQLIINAENMWAVEMASRSSAKTKICFIPSTVAGNNSSSTRAASAAIILAIQTGVQVDISQKIAREYNEYIHFRYIRHTINTKKPQVSYLQIKNPTPHTPESFTNSISKITEQSTPFTTLIAANSKKESYDWIYKTELSPILNSEKIIITGKNSHIIALYLKIIGAKNLQIIKNINHKIQKELGFRNFILILDHKKYTSTKNKILISLNKIKTESQKIRKNKLNPTIQISNYPQILNQAEEFPLLCSGDVPNESENNKLNTITITLQKSA